MILIESLGMVCQISFLVNSLYRRIDDIKMMSHKHEGCFLNLWMVNYNMLIPNFNNTAKKSQKWVSLQKSFFEPFI